MIKLSEVERIHQILIDQFGGTTGIRDLEALKSALDRPYQTFDEKELYPTVLEKVASLLESILTLFCQILKCRDLLTKRLSGGCFDRM